MGHDHGAYGSRPRCVNTTPPVQDCFKLRNKTNVEVHGILDRLSFVWYSMYADQLTWWFQHFKPSQFLIWSSKDFHHVRECSAVPRCIHTSTTTQNPEAHMSQLVEWLGLPLESINTEVKLSRTIGSAMYISKIPRDLTAKFDTFYKPHNERLFQVSYRVIRGVMHTTSLCTDAGEEGLFHHSTEVAAGLQIVYHCHYPPPL